jgi:hypothetical protein
MLREAISVTLEEHKIYNKTITLNLSVTGDNYQMSSQIFPTEYREMKAHIKVFSILQ